MGHDVLGQDDWNRFKSLYPNRNFPIPREVAIKLHNKMPDCKAKLRKITSLSVSISQSTVHKTFLTITVSHTASNYMIEKRNSNRTGTWEGDIRFDINIMITFNLGELLILVRIRESSDREILGFIVIKLSTLVRYPLIIKVKHKCFMHTETEENIGYVSQ